MVSVIIPAYNKMEYTKRCIKSVLSQTYSDIEVIVVDDGSSDGTKDMLYQFHHEITVVRQVNQGASAARNKGIEMARGEFIALLDCDDMYHPQKLELSVTEDKDFIYTPAWIVDKYDNIVRLYRPPHVGLMLRNSICNSVVIKKKCFDRVGLFDESLFVCADWDMWLRMQEHYELTYLDIPLTYYRYE